MRQIPELRMLLAEKTAMPSERAQRVPWWAPWRHVSV